MALPPASRILIAALVAKGWAADTTPLLERAIFFFGGV
tara:strand:- start:215 stop:328 length:114 start_codon:yes stop_codon:yes gene_type:complete